MNDTESSLPAEFAEALAGADRLSFRPEIHVTDIPAPEGIALVCQGLDRRRLIIEVRMLTTAPHDS
jgi:hypothetical protein